MRRLLAIAMMLVLVLPLAAPALGQTIAQTPICCRMGGVHKCMLHASETDTSPRLRERCPVQTQQAAPGHATSWMVGTPGLASGATSVAAMKAGQVEAGFRISFYRSRQKRGPPSVHTS